MMKKILAIATAAAVISGIAGFDLAQASCGCGCGSKCPCQSGACPVVQQPNQCCTKEAPKCQLKKHKSHNKMSKKHMTGAACPMKKRHYNPVTYTPYQKLCPSTCCPAAPIQRSNGCGCN
jgi:hypothetical protein